MNEIISGTIYRHYKGEVCKILFESEHTETGEILVNYTHSNSPKVWSRPKEIFLEQVDFDRQQIPRFELIKV